MLGRMLYRRLAAAQGGVGAASAAAAAAGPSSAAAAAAASPPRLALLRHGLAATSSLYSTTPQHAAVQESAARAAFRRAASLGLPLAMIGTLAYAFAFPDYEGGLLGDGAGAGHGDATPAQVGRRGETVVNWSGTHEASPRAYYSPETEEDVEAIVRDAHRGGRRLRAVGGALSPNGLALSDGQGMISLGLLDRVLSVDQRKREVTVQAGARVQSVADHLRPLGLTLQNYASIREQHVAGFTQVSAHGTGAVIPPVDEQVVALRLVTPAKGTIDLRADSDDPREREMFQMARCGLGCMGVVTRVTLKCVASHRLVERTFVASPGEVRRRHAEWLRSHQHLRYMWIPGAAAVVVVQCDAVEQGSRQERAAMREAAADKDKGKAAAGDAHPHHHHHLGPMRALLAEAAGGESKLGAAVTPGDVESMSLPELRDALVSVNPLDAQWIRRVNKAEAECWRRSAGVRVGWSDEILGFDCGGQQWVLEVAFPVGSLDDVKRECGGGGGGGAGASAAAAAAAASAAEKEDARAEDAALAPLLTGSRDLRYMGELLRLVRKEGIPAPSPIEQRWTAGSASPMSPASRFGGRGGGGGGAADDDDDANTAAARAAAAAGRSPADAVHSWVGVIMYLPTSDPKQRDAITRAFRGRYASLVEREMMPRYGAAWHWAKIEPPASGDGRSADAGALARMRAALARRYPLAAFNALRGELDPKNVLGNELVDALLGVPTPVAAAKEVAGGGEK
jgi:L-galactono-1,4-lactone dehydrogenase